MSSRNRHGQGPVRPESYEQIDHKTSQLCRQVQDAVADALACGANPVFHELYVVEVVPLRGASLLQVRIASEEEHADYDELNDALARAVGYVRAEVARAVHRKRVPVLELVAGPDVEVER